MERLYEYRENTLNTIFFLVVFALAIILFLGGVWLLRSKPPKAPQQVRITEEILTVQMNPTVLMDALEERAAEWCTVKRSIPVFGDIVISNIDKGLDVYNQVFLTDSMAPAMAREYPHLYKYSEKDDHKSFTMSAGANSVTVPVWLVKALIEKDVLVLPKEEQTRENVQ